MRSVPPSPRPTSHPYPRYGSLTIRPSSTSSPSARRSPRTMRARPKEEDDSDDDSGRARRKPVTHETKQRICIAALGSPWLSHQELAAQHGTNTSTVSRTLKDAHIWRDVDEAGRGLSRRRPLMARYAQIADEVSVWLEAQLAKDRKVREADIKRRAQRVAEDLYEQGADGETFAAAKWFAAFITRYGFVIDAETGLARRAARNMDSARVSGMGEPQCQLPQGSRGGAAASSSVARGAGEMEFSEEEDKLEREEKPDARAMPVAPTYRSAKWSLLPEESPVPLRAASAQRRFMGRAV